jgi:hypothetical protein
MQIFQLPKLRVCQQAHLVRQAENINVLLDRAGSANAS